jgi:hypothetical protein
MKMERIRALLWPSSSFDKARLTAGVLGLALAGASMPGLFGATADASVVAEDGTNWGPSGLLSTSSAVTARWDNTGNPATSVVYRDGRQRLPHTAGATYDSIKSTTTGPYFDYFGTDNGLGGLQVKVSQTKDLVNQSVTLEVSGVKGGAPYGTPSPVYLQAFQCWGGVDAAGRPAPDAANPDPATCQVGAMDPTAYRSPETAFTRYIKSDPLVPGGDWERYYANADPLSDVPFTAIDGQKSGSTNGVQNQFFNATTTNEASKIQMSASGTATRQMELQSSLESPGLGCGLRRGVTSTSTCWLVIVPRIDGVLQQNGPIAPSLWAQRLQVKLGFRDIVAGCPSGEARTLTAGSELLGAAAASWTPGLCEAKNIALGYTRLGDEVARNQFIAGANSAILTSKSVDAEAAYVPVSLAAPVVAYSLSYQPNCPARTDPYTEAEATECGYASVAELEADLVRAGKPIRDLKLNARLVAKLLTQSYAFAIFDRTGFERKGWMVERPSSLGDDPEFLRLNPTLTHISKSTSAINEMNRLIVEATRSDGAVQVWNWILGDADARAFLNGCPDADGMVVNPFYSTRTYQGCESARTALAAQADADRAATPTSDNYVDSALTYPPDGSPYPLPGWQEADPGGGFPPYTVYDFLVRADTMPVAGRDNAIGYVPQNSELCLTELDPSCQPAPGKYKDPKTRQPGDRLGLMSITDAATAAAFQLPTAQFCDSTGTKCVGATTTSFAKAADRFVDTAVEGVVEPGPADYAGGAYPLTVPVYAAVSTKIPAKDQRAYGRALSYLTTTGQKPGFAPGDLPPGYTPLTKSLRKQAEAGIDTLLSASDAQPSESPTATPTPTTTPTTGGGGLGGTTIPPPTSSTPSGSTPSPSASPSAPAGDEVQLAAMTPGQETWPSWLLPFGLALALLAGAAGPLVRLRSRIRLG